MKTTNYKNTFIAVAEDCKSSQAVVPPLKANKTVANLQFDMMAHHPYAYTSDDIIYATHVSKKGTEALPRDEFFASGKACLRTSPLAKTYGWGIHSNADCKVAIYPVESEMYEQLSSDKNINQTKAMRSKRV